ncbi:helix-turn-helix domain-containing protein [Streptomyces sp. NPDC004069]
MVTQTPERLSLPVLAALCDILDVTPAELIATGRERGPAPHRRLRRRRRGRPGLHHPTHAGSGPPGVVSRTRVRAEDLFCARCRRPVRIGAAHWPEAGAREPGSDTVGVRPRRHSQPAVRRRRGVAATCRCGCAPTSPRRCGRRPARTPLTNSASPDVDPRAAARPHATGAGLALTVLLSFLG